MKYRHADVHIVHASSFIYFASKFTFILNGGKISENIAREAQPTQMYASRAWLCCAIKIGPAKAFAMYFS